MRENVFVDMRHFGDSKYNRKTYAQSKQYHVILEIDE